MILYFCIVQGYKDKGYCLLKERMYQVSEYMPQKLDLSN